MAWQPSEKDQHYRLTGEATWDCTVCCLDGHPASAHDGTFAYALGYDGAVTIMEAPPCMLIDADHIRDIVEGSVQFPGFGRLDGDLLRLQAANRTLIYRLTEQPVNERPPAFTPAVAELIPPYGQTFLAEWPD